MILNKRKDIVTQERYERNELIRIAIQKDGVTTIDKEYNQGGRGIYIHPSSMGKAIEKNILKSQLKRYKGDYSSIVELLKKEEI